MTREELKADFLKRVSSYLGEQANGQDEKKKPTEGETVGKFLEAKVQEVLKLKDSTHDPLNSPAGVAALLELTVRLEHAINHNAFNRAILAQVPNPSNGAVIENFGFQFSNDANPAVQREKAIRLLRFSLESLRTVGNAHVHRLPNFNVGAGSMNFPTLLANLERRVQALEGPLTTETYGPRKSLTGKIIGAETVGKGAMGSISYAIAAHLDYVGQAYEQAGEANISFPIIYSAAKTCRRVFSKWGLFIGKGGKNKYQGKTFTDSNPFPLQCQERFSGGEAAAYSALDAMKDKNMRTVQLS